MQGYEQVLAEIREGLAPFAQKGQAIHEDTRLVEDLGLDSLKVMDLLLEVEDRFDLAIPLNILSDVQTVRDLAQKLEKLIQEQ